MISAINLLSLADLKTIDHQKVNPRAEEAQARARQICQEAGIYLSNIDSYNDMSAFLYPEASLDRLVAMMVIMDFLFYVDELYEQHLEQDKDRRAEAYLHQVFENCARIMYTGQLPADDHELYRACFATYELVRPLTNEPWLRSFIKLTQQHLQSITYNLDDILSEGDDAVEKYIAFRGIDSGMRPAIHLIEFANGFYLPPEVKYHPVIRHLENMTANVGGLMNDIFSYEKEVIRLHSRFNLVAVLQDYQGLLFAEAVHAAVNIVNQQIDSFLQQEQGLPDFGDKTANALAGRYVQGLRDQINATWYWQMTTDRYRSPNSPYPELRTMPLEVS
jgi:hypothetical protein